jgi:N-acetylmuramate 1-kinase
MSAAVALDERITAYFTDRGRADRALVEPLSGDASTRRYFRVRDDGRTAVLALYPEPFEVAELSFAVVRDLLDGYGLPVPRILDHDGPRGILLLEDLGDLTLQEALVTASAAERDAYYGQSMEQIALLQKHGRPGATPAPCFEIAFDTEKLSWELQYFVKHFVEGHRQIVLTGAERDAIAACCQALASEIASWPRVLCHRDYHSRNLMVQDRALSWVDFQDARMGPATYDLASLLRDAYVELSEEFIAWAAESFRAAALPDEPREVFERRFDLMCVQRNLKALGTFGYMDVVRGNRIYLQYVPRTLAHARRNLTARPELATLHRLLSAHIEELR